MLIDSHQEGLKKRDLLKTSFKILWKRLGEHTSYKGFLEVVVINFSFK